MSGRLDPGDGSGILADGVRWRLVGGDGTHPSTWEAIEPDETAGGGETYETGEVRGWLNAGALTYAPLPESYDLPQIDPGDYYVFMGPEPPAPDPVPTGPPLEQSIVRGLPASAQRWVLDRLPGWMIDAELADVRDDLEGSDPPTSDPDHDCGPSEVWDPTIGACRTLPDPAQPPDGEQPEGDPPNCGPNAEWDPAIGACRSLPTPSPPEDDEGPPSCPDGQRYDESIGACVPTDDGDGPGNDPGDEPGSAPGLPGFLDLGVSIGPLTNRQTTLAIGAGVLLLAAVAGGN
jgi:hypothetical protein